MYSASNSGVFLRARRGVGAVAIGLVGTLAGCGSSTPSTASPPSPPPTRTPTHTATVDGGDPALWRSGPGFIGPLRVGASAASLRRAGYVDALAQMACGVRWEATRRLTSAGLDVEFRGGDPNVLDAVIAGSRNQASRYPFKTAEGVGIGTTTARLKEVYGDLAYGRWATNSGYYVGWVRNTPSGSILFNVGSTEPEDNAVGDGSHVTMIVVTASPFRGIVDGC